MPRRRHLNPKFGGHQEDNRKGITRVQRNSKEKEEREEKEEHSGGEDKSEQGRGEERVQKSSKRKRPRGKYTLPNKRRRRALSNKVTRIEESSDGKEEDGEDKDEEEKMKMKMEKRKKGKKKRRNGCQLDIITPLKLLHILGIMKGMLAQNHHLLLHPKCPLL